jgi:hypothetical protein
MVMHYTMCVDSLATPLEIHTSARKLPVARNEARKGPAMFVLCTEPALPNLRRIGPQDHFGTNLEPSRLDPIVKVVRKLFRGFHFTVTVRITDRGLFVRGPR